MSTCRWFGEKQAQVAEVVAGRTGGHRVAERGEERTGIECGEGFFGAVAEGDGAADRGGIGDGASAACIAVDAVGAGAEDYEMLAGVLGELEGAG